MWEETSWNCRIFLTGCLGEASKVGKGSEQDGLKRKYRDREKMVKGVDCMYADCQSIHLCGCVLLIPPDCYVF